MSEYSLIAHPSSLISKYGLATKKSLGQHFLLDENICANIAALAGDVREHTIIEIGPGPGGLTRALLQAGAKHVIAVETDPRCVEALQELVAASDGRLSVQHADALKISLPTLCPGPRKIVSNLPYNVGTALFTRWLDDGYAQPGSYASMTLMFQQEVAGRIAAPPGGKDYGRLSVISQWLSEITPHFVLPPGAFSPPPKVHSAVISVVPRAQPAYPADKKTLERVLAAGFNQRRKMLRAALKSISQQPQALLASAGIDETRRAETLSVEEWCVLARKLA